MQILPAVFCRLAKLTVYTHSKKQSMSPTRDNLYDILTEFLLTVSEYGSKLSGPINGKVSPDCRSSHQFFFFLEGIHSVDLVR